jgi:membrane protease YdiL (CAAX protease family)
MSQLGGRRSAGVRCSYSTSVCARSAMNAYLIHPDLKTTVSARTEMGNNRHSTVSAIIKRHQLAVFLVVSVALGSLATALLAGLPVRPIILALVALPISYIPAVLAVLMLRVGADAGERRAFRRRLTAWRIGPGWYLTGVVMVPFAHLAGVALATFWDGKFPFHLEQFALLPLLIVTNLGEEIGWRGYALPRLQRHFNSLAASGILGVSWAAFHWVALGQNPNRPWGYVAVGSVSIIAMSVVMTWLFNRTGGSVVLMVVLHAMYDVVSVAVVPLAETGLPLLAFALSGTVLCLVAVVLVLIDGPQLNGPPRARMRRAPAARPTR